MGLKHVMLAKHKTLDPVPLAQVCLYVNKLYTNGFYQYFLLDSLMPFTLQTQAEN